MLEIGTEASTEEIALSEGMTITEQVEATNNLKQLASHPLDKIHDISNYDPRLDQGTTYVQLMEVIEDIEEEAGLSITQGPLPLLTHTKNEAYEAVEDIMFYRIGQVRMVRAVIKEHQIETLGQLVATIRSLEEIAELE